MTRDEAIELARECAAEKPESYYAAPFMPHEWVIDAILAAAEVKEDMGRLIQQARDVLATRCTWRDREGHELIERLDRAIDTLRAAVPAGDELLRRVDAELATATPDELADLDRRSEQAFNAAFCAAGIPGAPKE